MQDNGENGFVKGASEDGSYLRLTIEELIKTFPAFRPESIKNKMKVVKGGVADTTHKRRSNYTRR